MSEEQAPKAPITPAEENAILRRMLGLYQALMGILVGDMNQWRGNHWRALFGPKAIENAKRLSVQIATAQEVAQPVEILKLVQEHLQIELPLVGAISEAELIQYKMMLPPELLKRTF